MEVSVNVRLFFSLLPVGKADQECLPWRFSCIGQEGCVLPPPSTHSLSEGCLLSWVVCAPHCLQVAKAIKFWSSPAPTPWRLASAPFATSGLITFLFDYCSSLPGLPAAQPSPTHSAPGGAFQPPHSVPAFLCLQDAVPASGLVLWLLQAQPLPPVGDCLSVLICKCWWLGEPKITACILCCFSSTCHRSLAFVDHLSVTPRRQRVLSPKDWPPVHVQTPRARSLTWQFTMLSSNSPSAKSHF